MSDHSSRRLAPLHCVSLQTLALVVGAALGAAAPVQAQSASLAAFSNELQSLAQRVGPSIVQINVSGYALAEASGSATADTRLERQRSTGSGVIVDASGYVVTNDT